MELTGADELDLVSAFGQHSGPYAHTVSCDERNRSVHRAINPSLCRSYVVYLPNGLRQQGTRCPVRRTAGRSGQPVRPWPWRPIRAVAAERSKSPRVVPASSPDPVGSRREGGRGESKWGVPRGPGVPNGTSSESRGLRGFDPAASGPGVATWLILPVVICLSQRLSHACLSTNFYIVKPRMAH